MNIEAENILKGLIKEHKISEKAAIAIWEAAIECAISQAEAKGYTTVLHKDNVGIEMYLSVDQFLQGGGILQEGRKIFTVDFRVRPEDFYKSIGTYYKTEIDGDDKWIHVKGGSLKSFLSWDRYHFVKIMCRPKYE